MSTFQALFLGFIQGITEFLPISSSGHLILIPWFFKWTDPGLAFDVFLHLGTFIAVLCYFARDWWVLLRAGIASILERKIGYERERMVFWLIMVGTIPAGIAGYLFHEHVETALRAPLLIAISLALVGFLLYWVDGKYSALRGIEELTMKDSIWIGIAQALAIIPGVSRSGSTMTMGRVLGLNREAAARYSFLLSLPITAAAMAFKFKDLVKQVGTELPWAYVLSGFFSSLVFGMLSIHLLLRYLRFADFRVFAWYRLLLAGLIIVWSLFVRP